MVNPKLRRMREAIPSPSGSGLPMTRFELAQAVNEYIWRTTGQEVSLDAETISRYERGLIRWPGEAYRAGLRAVLGADHDAALGFHPTPRGRSMARRPGSPHTPGKPSRELTGSVLRIERGALHAGGGRYFSGTAIDTLALSAVVERGFATAEVSDMNELLRPGHRLTLMSMMSDDGVTSFALDVRAARRTILNAGGTPVLRVPTAYHLDDFASAILWAATNYDVALLDDDAALEDATRTLSVYESRLTSTVTGTGTGALSTVSRMWLGSRFCAEHIFRHAGELTDVPSFWTREQRGEEASSWLLFRHKLDYLAGYARHGVEVPRRAFCVPEDSVRESSVPERVLMFLCVALMESFGIVVDVGTDPELARVPGFVTDREGRAIVANWIGGEGLWHVDVSDSRARLREFTDVLGAVGSHSITGQPDPQSRLEVFAAYLGLDWSWMTRRSREFGLHGTTGLVQPRSRLLSVGAIDRACAFVGTFDDVAAR